MATYTIECPHCGASFRVGADKFGRKGRCSKCHGLFKVAELPSDDAEPDAQPALEGPSQDLTTSANQLSLIDTSQAQPPKRKSLFAMAKEWVDAAARRFNVVYMHGPWSVKANSPMVMSLDENGLLLRVGLINKLELLIGYDRITGITLETAERLGKLRTLGAGALGAALGGPLGGPFAAAIVGFGIKKKDQFLVLEFTDHVETSVAVFRKGPGCDIATLKGCITHARHDYLLSHPRPRQDEVDDVKTIEGTDISSTIEKLAQLRDKGILTEQEFQAKKAELLSRL